MAGHTKKTYFKLPGYPNWYKELKEHRADFRSFYVANMKDNPLD